MVKVKVINISPHSPAGEILEVEEAKAKELVKLKKVVYENYTTKPETKIEKVKLKKIEASE